MQDFINSSTKAVKNKSYVGRLYCEGPTGERASDTCHVYSNIFYSVIDSLIKELDSQLPASLKQFLSFVASYKAAFDCSYKLLLIAKTLPVISASCERRFSKIKLVKTFLRNSMTIERLL